jgi:hypothetical protein
LQSQLNTKASTSALSATAASIGADLDGVEVTLGVVGSTVGALGSLVEGVVGAVATKAAQSSLDATNASVSALSVNLNNVAASLTTNLNNVSTLLGTRASTASLTSGLALKQDLLSQTLTLGALSIDGDPAVAILKHDEGVALQTVGGSTFAVFTPAGATLRQLILQEALVVPDASIAIAKIGGLTAALAGKASTEDLTSLVSLADGKQDHIDESLTFSSGLFRLSGAGNSFSIQRLIDGAYSPVMSLQYNNGLSRISVFGELRPASIVGLSILDVLDTLSATQVLASNLYTKSQTDALVASSIPAIADGSLTIAKTSDLQRQLDDINDIRRAIQAQLAGVAANGIYTQQDVDALTIVVNAKLDKAEFTEGLLTRATISSLVAG